MSGQLAAAPARRSTRSNVEQARLPTDRPSLAIQGLTVGTKTLPRSRLRRARALLQRGNDAAGEEACAALGHRGRRARLPQSDTPREVPPRQGHPGGRRPGNRGRRFYRSPAPNDPRRAGRGKLALAGHDRRRGYSPVVGRSRVGGPGRNDRAGRCPSGNLDGDLRCACFPGRGAGASALGPGHERPDEHRGARRDGHRRVFRGGHGDVSLRHLALARIAQHGPCPRGRSIAAGILPRHRTSNRRQANHRRRSGRAGHRGLRARAAGRARAGRRCGDRGLLGGESSAHHRRKHPRRQGGRRAGLRGHAQRRGFATGRSPAGGPCQHPGPHRPAGDRSPGTTWADRAFHRSVRASLHARGDRVGRRAGVGPTAAGTAGRRLGRRDDRRRMVSARARAAGDCLSLRAGDFHPGDDRLRIVSGKSSGNPDQRG